MIWERFSLRQKKLRGEVSDVFVYDQVPRALRAQVCHILSRCLGYDPQDDFSPRNPAYLSLRQEIAEELGVFDIGYPNQGCQAAIFNFLTNNATDEQALDIIELAFRCALKYQNDYQFAMFNPSESAPQAINSLNVRFLEHQVGYTFVDGGMPQLIRRDNEQLHKEAILPALRLLHEEGFEGANDEYRNAHEHYRKGNHKECLNDCLKALESAIKTICTRKRWKFDPGKATASQLIDTCVENNLFPASLSGAP